MADETPFPATAYTQIFGPVLVPGAVVPAPSKWLPTYPAWHVAPYRVLQTGSSGSAGPNLYPAATFTGPSWIDEPYLVAWTGAEGALAGETPEPPAVPDLVTGIYPDWIARPFVPVTHGAWGTTGPTLYPGAIFVSGEVIWPVDTRHLAPSLFFRFTPAAAPSTPTFAAAYYPAQIDAAPRSAFSVITRALLPPAPPSLARWQPVLSPVYDTPRRPLGHVASCPGTPIIPSLARWTPRYPTPTFPVPVRSTRAVAPLLPGAAVHRALVAALPVLIEARRVLEGQLVEPPRAIAPSVTFFAGIYPTQIARPVTPASFVVAPIRFTIPAPTEFAGIYPVLLTLDLTRPTGGSTPVSPFTAPVIDQWAGSYPSQLEQPRSTASDGSTFIVIVPAPLSADRYRRTLQIRIGGRTKPTKLRS